MDAVLRMRGEEAGNGLLEFIKNTFSGKKLVVHIYEDEAGMDETEYLLSDPENKTRLLKSVEEINNGTPTLHTFTLEELRQKFDVE